MYLGFVSRQSRRRRHRHQRRARKAWAIVLSVLFVILISGFVSGGAVAYHYYNRLHACTLDGLSPIQLGQNSFVYASDGSLLGVIPSLYNRQPIALENMSPWLLRATVAIEDKRFYQHGALDYRAMVRAAVADLKAGKTVQGASTITQQLARNLYPISNADTLNRKIKEACLAEKISERWSKDHILNAYMNQVYYGEQAYGVSAAARTYFSKKADKLTLAEAAMIAGLPQAPSSYNPFRNPAVAKARRNEVLQALWTQGLISGGQFSKASAAPLGLHRGHFYHRVSQPLLFNYVYAQLVSRYGIDVVQRGGLHVYTTIDLRLQGIAYRAARAALPLKSDPAVGIATVNARTGEIKALASWVSKYPNSKFNLASQAHRQAGSSFKLFALTDALTRGIDPYSTYYLSAPFTYQPTYQAKPWEVHTDDNSYYGSESLHDATVHSDNTVFARLTLDLGPQLVADMAHLLGIDSALRPVPSISLGTNPVTPLEMASAYATIASGGIYRKPTAIRRIVFADGRKSPWYRDPPARVIPYAVAYTVTKILEDNVSYGTGTRAQISGRTVAGKTGTTSDFTDGWFCGYTPQLSTAVWVGYLHGEIPMRNVHGIEVFGGTFPAQIWRSYMVGALANLPTASWPEPKQSVPYHYWRGRFQNLSSYTG